MTSLDSGNIPRSRPPALPPVLVFANTVWVVLIAISLFRGLLVDFPRHRGIYDVYKWAGQNWLAGHDLYLDRDSLMIFRYAPVVAAALTPLAELPDMAGCLLFRAVNLAVFLAGANAFRRQASWARPESTEEGWYRLILAPLAAVSLLDVQVNTLTTGLMLLALAAVPRARWNLAAICLSVVVLLKLYPIALALLCVILWPRRLSWRLALALLAGLALPFVLRNPEYVWEQYQRWFHLIGLNDRQRLSLLDWYRDIRLPLARLGLIVTPRSYSALQLATAVLTALLVLRLRSPAFAMRDRLGMVYGLAACWMMAFGPATEGVTYVMIAPSVAWLAADWLSRPHGWAWKACASAVVGFFVLNEVAPILPYGSLYRAFGPQPVAAVGLMLMLAVRTLRAPRSETVPIVRETPSPRQETAYLALLEA